MKLIKVITLCAVFMLLAIVPVNAGQHGFTLNWTAPTTEILADDCTKVGVALTKPITYTVQIRISGTSSWTSAEAPTNTFNFTNLLADTTYEARVGAHYTGGTVFCFSSPVSVKTLPDQPPAACTNVTPSNIQ